AIFPTSMERSFEPISRSTLNVILPVTCPCQPTPAKIQPIMLPTTYASSPADPAPRGLHDGAAIDSLTRPDRRATRASKARGRPGRPPPRHPAPPLRGPVVPIA